MQVACRSVSATIHIELCFPRPCCRQAYALRWLPYVCVGKRWKAVWGCEGVWLFRHHNLGLMNCKWHIFHGLLRACTARRILINATANFIVRASLITSVSHMRLDEPARLSTAWQFCRKPCCALRVH